MSFYTMPYLVNGMFVFSMHLYQESLTEFLKIVHGLPNFNDAMICLNSEKMLSY